MSYRRHFRGLGAVIAAISIASQSFAATSERIYNFGEVEGGTVGNDITLTFDDSGPSGAFIDLLNAPENPTGSVQYASDATRSGVVASFNGSGRLSTGFGFNRPSEFWDNPNYFGDTPDSTPPSYPLNYEGLFGRGIQVWVNPASSALGNGRQDIIMDTLEHGIFVTDAGNWGLWYDNDPFDSGVAASGDTWTHVMSLGGTSDLTGGTSAFGGALYVNGIAVSAAAFLYDSDESEMSIGGAQSGAAEPNYFTGKLDDLEVFLWGDNSDADVGLGGQVGQDWGVFDLLVDNEWVAEELASRGITDPDPLDVNLDGTVEFSTPTDADVQAFVFGWGSENTVDGVAIGDFASRQIGDINIDGVVDIEDWALLNSASNGLAGSLIAAALDGATVPEPQSIGLLAATGAAVVLWLRRRGR